MGELTGAVGRRWCCDSPGSQKPGTTNPQKHSKKPTEQHWYIWQTLKQKCYHLAKLAEKGMMCDH